ncbi:MAG: hypothetical protein JRJ38_18210 [Deltaproteobacteria bacterium]|nr:hypothetical protein [Deltaproteobacteria bacterium]
MAAKSISIKENIKSTEEFDRQFDDGEDVHDLIDMSKSKIIRDIPFDMLKALVHLLKAPVCGSP